MQAIERKIITEAATAIKLRIDALYKNGTLFDQAKWQAIKEFEFVSSYATYRSEILSVVDDIQLSDLDKAARQQRCTDVYQEALKANGSNDTFIRRIIWRWFSVLI